MAEDDADYQRIISQMIEHKQTIISAKATIEAVAEIKADLETEITVEEE